MRLLEIVTVCSLATVAHAGEQPKGAPPAVVADPSPVARVTLMGLGGAQVTGHLDIVALANGGVQFLGAITGLDPDTEHGFHIHEVGNCDAPDGSSAGAHFNPTAAPHGDVVATHSHAGDLGNIKSDATGKANVRVVKQGATVAAGKDSIIGRAVIVHKKRDDLHSQPAGESGGRIACGVIKAL